MSDSIFHLLDAAKHEAERLTECESLLGEIMATFAVNRDRLQWTGDELRLFYDLERGWRDRYDKIKRVASDSPETEYARAAYYMEHYQIGVIPSSCGATHWRLRMRDGSDPPLRFLVEQATVYTSWTKAVIALGQWLEAKEKAGA